MAFFEKFGGTKKALLLSHPATRPNSVFVSAERAGKTRQTHKVLSMLECMLSVSIFLYNSTCTKRHIAHMASIAQLAEHALRKRMVVGLIPTGGFHWDLTHSCMSYVDTCYASSLSLA